MVSADSQNIPQPPREPQRGKCDVELGVTHFMFADLGKRVSSERARYLNPQSTGQSRLSKVEYHCHWTRSESATTTKSNCKERQKLANLDTYNLISSAQSIHRASSGVLDSIALSSSMTTANLAEPISPIDVTTTQESSLPIESEPKRNKFHERKTEFFDIDEELPKKPKRSLKDTLSHHTHNSSPDSCATGSPIRSPFTELKEGLKQQWRRRQEERQKWFDETGGLSDDESFRQRIQALREESAALATVRKDRVFDSDVTEEEEKIIQRRVELQRLQLQEYEQREKSRVIARILFNFPYLTKDEIQAGLAESNNSEESILLNITHPEFLMKVRKRLALQYEESGKCSKLNAEQRAAYRRLVERRKRSVNRTTTEESKIRSVKYSKLRLDEAIEKLNAGEDPAKVFEGWSEARIKAYKQIHIKPNVYYYRFNAPGEKQENGPWRPEEKELFLKRLKEHGTNGQWGIFSMAIPGRVGYQCSNYYRHLIKTGEIQDPNYTMNENGELRYLFGKKNGKEGVIRTHRKHGTADTGTHHKMKDKEQADIAAAARMFVAVKASISCSSSASKELFSNDECGTFVERAARQWMNSNAITAKTPTAEDSISCDSGSQVDARAESVPASDTTLTGDVDLESRTNGSVDPISNVDSGEQQEPDQLDGEPVKRKRGRPKKKPGDPTAPYRKKAKSFPRPEKDMTGKPLRSQRNDFLPGESGSIVSGLSSSAEYDMLDEFSSDAHPDSDFDEKPIKRGRGRPRKSESLQQFSSASVIQPGRKKRGRPRKHTDDPDFRLIGQVPPVVTRSSFNAELNPLPGFIDPITLEEVVKPAISKYGHVMGYDSWLRCLNAEDRKNICPITKKPLAKRELVILTPENIEEYQ